MAITIRGIRIVEIELKPKEEGQKMTCTYELISSTDKVLAKQTIGGYGGLELSPSPATLKAMESFLTAYKGDIQELLGIEAC